MKINNLKPVTLYHLKLFLFGKSTSKYYISENYKFIINEIKDFLKDIKQ